MTVQGVEIRVYLQADGSYVAHVEVRGENGKRAKGKAPSATFDGAIERAKQTARAWVAAQEAKAAVDHPIPVAGSEVGADPAPAGDHR